MRVFRAALLLSALCSIAAPRPASAQSVPSPVSAAPPVSVTPSVPAPPVVAGTSAVRFADLPGPLLAAPRANVASLVPVAMPLVPRFGSSGSGGPLRITGTIVISLGAATLLGAGLAAIVAGVTATDLEDECPGKVCYEDSRGGRSLDRTRDAARATDWLIGIGGPVTASGLVMLIYSAVLERRDSASRPSPIFRAGPGGASLTVHF